MTGYEALTTAIETELAALLDQAKNSRESGKRNLQKKALTSLKGKIGIRAFTMEYKCTISLLPICEAGDFSCGSGEALLRL